MTAPTAFPWLSAALGALAGLSFMALVGCDNLPGFVIYAGHGALCGAFAGAICRGRAGNPGAAWRQSALVVVSVMTTFVYFRALEWVDSEPSPWSGPAYVFVSVIGGVPALLLGAWAEKARLRPGRPWWLARGAVVGLLQMYVVCLLLPWGVGRDGSASFVSPQLWSDALWPWQFFGFLLVEVPLEVSKLTAPSLAIALFVSFDKRWRRPDAPEASPGPASTPLAG